VVYRALYTLQNTTKQFGMKISPLKFKVMAFKEQVPITSKTVTDNTLEQVNIFIHIWDVNFHTKRKTT
jgi:hypothetical protein